MERAQLVLGIFGGGAVAGGMLLELSGDRKHMIRGTGCSGLSRMGVLPRMWDFQC